MSLSAEPAKSSSSGGAADWAFEQLRSRIVAGDLKPGEKLIEATLAESIQVSRTPLREAINRLEMMGLLVRQRNRSVQVAPLSAEEMIRLSMLREALEGLLVRHVATRKAAGEISIAPLEVLIDQMSAVDPTVGSTLLLRLGERFHVELSRLSGDPLGARFLQTVVTNMERYRYLVEYSGERIGAVIREHKAVMDAIRSGDADRAEQEIRSHIEAARRFYMRRLDEADVGSANRSPKGAR